jgi:hypothetical protein
MTGCLDRKLRSAYSSSNKTNRHGGRFTDGYERPKSGGHKIRWHNITCRTFSQRLILHDVIVGQDILEAARAPIRTLYDELLNIPMTHFGDFELVKTISAVTIPPLSEAHVNVQCTHRPTAGAYMIEGRYNAANNPLIIGKTLMNTSNS